jgi:Golgi nucleoside diphosphatase
MHISVILLVLAALALFAQASIAYDGREVKPSATMGMVIDAGSGGSRMHVYTWQPRRFSTVPPPLSYPEGNEQWTSRTIPGIDMFTDDLDGIADHLAPLIDFAKRTLIDFKGQYADFPIYFYATGGLREVEQSKRDLVIAKVRELLSDKENNPFFFKQNYARIISGEEEAIFSWAATNFLMGTLLPASHGTGIVSNVNDTYGTVDLGGASTQIAYYIPTQDILEGLYKFQLGSQKQVP